jgi:hypothetical protein
MRGRFRVIRGGLNNPSSQPRAGDDVADPALTRRLRGLYAPPGEGYWDGLEATIMAAVRAGRAAPAAAAEWWFTLARWARPGLAAATVLLGVVGGVYLQTSGARQDTAAGSILEEPPAYTIEPLDAELARAADAWASESPSRARDARVAADLLTDGVKRPANVHLELDDVPAVDSAAASGDSVRPGRRAASRHALP